MKKLFLILFIVSVSLQNYSQVTIENFPESKNEHLVMATLWYQKSAEMRALYYQAYNIATIMLDKHLAEYKGEKKTAVVFDIDETLLDNSPFEGKCILENYNYSDSLWVAWTSLKIAAALPGAAEFAKYAESKGVEVFYISNRSVDELEQSMVNLADKGFPYISESHFLLKTNTSDKESRREIVREDYEILLLVGDNLGDFSNIFDSRPENYGFGLVDEYKNEFGSKFIVLPNPMYGTWEKTIYGGTNKLSDDEKKLKRRDSIISF